MRQRRIGRSATRIADSVADVNEIRTIPVFDREYGEYEDMLANPLLSAALRGEAEVVARLVKAGADLNGPKDSDDFQGHVFPLYSAISVNNVTAVKILLDAGADPNFPVGASKPLDYAGSMLNEERVFQTDWLLGIIIVMLVQSGADIHDAGAVVWKLLKWDYEYTNNSPYYPMMEEVFRAFLDAGYDVNARHMGTTLLLHAMTHNTPKVVQWILDKRPDVNATDEKGNTPLMIAADRDWPDIVRRLIAAGAQVNSANEKGETALLRAASVGSTDVAKILLENGARRDLSAAFCNALCTEASHRYSLYELNDHKRGRAYQCAKELEKAGANITECEDVVRCAAFHDDVELIDRLMTANVGDATDVLLKALGAGSMDVALQAIRMGADVNQYKSGYYSLIMASVWMEIYPRSAEVAEVVKELIQRGASVNEKMEESGETVLEYAAMAGNVEIAKLLLDKGADVHAKDNDGGTPLFAAAISESGNVDVVRLLLDKGADIHVKTKRGSTPLIAAALSGKADVVQLLLDKGANVNEQDDRGTPLMVAARNGHVDVVKVLVSQKSVDINARDNAGHTALWYATNESNIPKIRDILIAAGAVE